MEYMIRQVKRIAIVAAGITVLLLGLAMIVLPGPAIVVIPAGLAILATEFVWARVVLNRLKKGAQDLKDRVVGRTTPNSTTPTVTSEAAESRRP